MSMNPESLGVHLSQIETCWTRLSRGLEGRAADEFLHVYGAAVRRYLLGLTRGDEPRAAELFQDFCVRLLEGRFRKASPEHGKFRHYLKRCLATLAADDWGRSARHPSVPIAEAHEPVAPDWSPVEEEEFSNAWRQALVAAALEALALEEKHEPRGRYTVLRARLQAPEATSEQLAAAISGGGRPVTAGWVRKRLMEARGRFAELLFDEIARTIDQPTADAVREELVDLGLWHFCRDYVEGSLKA
jgi:DNA-directed RNA polymerase specialized sigma24 family protein